MKSNVNHSGPIEILANDDEVEALRREQMRIDHFFDEFIRDSDMQNIIEQLFGPDAKAEILQHIEKDECDAKHVD